MDLHSLLTHLSNKGIKLAVNKDSLLVDAPKGVMTRELRDSLAEHKAEILLMLRQYDAGTSSAVLPTIVPAPEQRYEPFPLTDMQHAFWVGRSGAIELGGVSNHGYYEIEGQDLNLERLNWALQELVKRHDMLRAVVLPDGQQQILEQVPAYPFEILDLRGQEEAFVKAQLEAIREEMSHQVLPSDRWPLFDFRATCLDGGGIRLHISYDLLVFDAWSLFRLFEEWFQLYQNPEVALLPLELSFRDYALAEQGLRETELYKRSQNYWLSRIDSLPPAPDLPLAKSPQQLKQHRTKRYEGGINRTHWQQLKQCAAKAGLTPSGVLLAAFAEIMTLWSKSPQFTLNLALFNRLPLHSQVNEILGAFTSVTLLAVDNSEAETFGKRAVRLQKQLWQDLEHRYFSGVRVTRELSRRKGAVPNAMPVIFTSTLGFGSLGQETLTFSHFGELVYGISQASQAWMDIQVWEEKGTLTFNWDVVKELFPEGLIEDMFEAYCHFLKQLATSESAWVETTRQLIPPVQLTQRDAINATEAPVADELLHTLFTAQVKARGNELAIISPERNLTYQELCDRSHQVGHRLRKLGATPNQLIAVVMEKGWEQVVAVMGILAAGAAYVPIAPNLPPERFLYLLENSQANIVLTQSWLNEALIWPGGIRRLCINSEDLTTESKKPLQPVQNPDDLAYVIYTSGSTGLPKGVMITHRGVVNTILDINQRFGVSLADRVLALSSLNFDLSVYDIFGTLAAGGTIVIPKAAFEREPAHWAELIVQHNVTIWNSVPALMQMMVDYAIGVPKVLANLRLALLSGDWLPLTLPTQIKALVEGIQVISLGGATEASIWSILYPIQAVNPVWKSIPYGRPMTNQRFYILNDLLEPCPIWVPGQLYIGGIGLAQGYWREEAKTAASFITHPRTGERLYRTGDLGCYLPDGNIEFLGREDFQVKIGGYRIELGEIEAALIQHPAVKEAVATTIGKPGENKHLVAYFVPEPREESSFFETDYADFYTCHQLWQSLVQSGLNQAQHSLWDIDVKGFSEIWKYQDYLYTISVCRALRKLGVYQAPGEKYTIDDLISQCHIAPRYRKWLNRALKMLVEEGWLQQKDEEFESLAELPIHVSQKLPSEIKSQLSQNHKFTKNWLDLMPDAPDDNLADIITENIHSAEIYTSEKTLNTYQVMFADCNAIAKEVIRAVVQTLEPEKPLRILEVGAGFGSTAAHLLPLLPPQQTTYVFTDISNFFIEKAKENFSKYPFVRYGSLDLEKNPHEQGYEPHAFDIVIAATVLHNTRSIEETLQHIRSLLAPSGLLLAIEKTRFHRSFDLNMGLQQGFERFEDSQLRQEHPVLSKEQWHKTLSKLGFENSVFMNQPDSVADFIGFDVLVAQGPSSVQRYKATGVRDFLQKKLPEYMVPSEFILLDALPLTSNGKVDRLSLPGLQGLRSQGKAAYISPTTEAEQLIAKVWQEILQVENVGIHDNFFALGGDSLQATQIVSRLRETFQINIPVQSLLEAPSLASLAESIEQIYRTTQKLQAPLLDVLTDRVEIEL